MGFHFAKHLSLLVLASEREMSFDWAAISGSRRCHGSCASHLLCRVAWGGTVTEWGSWPRRCAMATGSYYKAPQMFTSLPDLCRGLLQGRVSCPLRALPLGLCPAHNSSEHLCAPTTCQILFYMPLPFIKSFQTHSNPMR